MADVKLPKPKYGQIFALGKNGEEPHGIPFPLTTTLCRIGRNEKVDIRVTSASVSQFHCNIVVDDETGQASLETLSESSITELNDEVLPPYISKKLNHKDIIRIGGRQLCFEYLPPDFKPKINSTLSSLKILTPIRKPPFIQPTNKSNDNGGNNEGECLSIMEEDSKTIEKAKDLEEEADLTEVEATPPQQILSVCPSRTKVTDKRVSFGPYLSPEQFDNTLPPATPVKRGGTPRKSSLYSSLKNMKSKTEILVEEGNEEGICKNDEENEEEKVEGTSKEEILTVERSTSEAILSRQLKLTYNVEQPSETLETFMEQDDQPNIHDSRKDVTDLTSSGTTLDVEAEITGSVAVNEQQESQSTVECSACVRSPEESPKPMFVDVDNISDVAEETTISPELPKPDFILEPETKALVETPKQLHDEPQADYTNVDGVKELLKTPRSLPETPKADYTDVLGIKQLMKTPRVLPGTPKADYTNVLGVKQLLLTPKQQPETPEADYTNVVGIKQLLATPRQQAETPQADYTNVEGVKDLMKSPKPIETPKADYTNVEGIKTLMETPKQIDTPMIEHTNVDGNEDLMKTPKPSTNAGEPDYSDVEGIKALLKTPKPGTPKADYTRVTGIKRLLKTPRPTAIVPDADYTNVEGIKELVETPKLNKVTSNAEGIIGLRKLPISITQSPIEDQNQLKEIHDVSNPQLCVTSPTENANPEGMEELENCVCTSSTSSTEETNNIPLNGKQNEEVASVVDSNLEEVSSVSNIPTKCIDGIDNLTTKESETCFSDIVNDTLEHKEMREAELIDIKNSDRVDTVESITESNADDVARINEIQSDDTTIAIVDSELPVEKDECHNAMRTTSKRRCRGKKMEAQENNAVLTSTESDVLQRTKRRKEYRCEFSSVFDPASDEKNNEVPKSDNDQNDNLDSVSVNSNDLKKAVIGLPQIVEANQDSGGVGGPSLNSRRGRRRATSKSDVSQSSRQTIVFEEVSTTIENSDNQTLGRVTRRRAAKENVVNTQADQNSKNKEQGANSKLDSLSVESDDSQKNQSHVVPNPTTKTRSRSAKSKKECVTVLLNTVQHSPQQSTTERPLRASRSKKPVEITTASTSPRVTRSKKEITKDSLPILKVSLVKLEEQENSAGIVSVTTRKANKDAILKEETKKLTTSVKLGKRVCIQSPTNATQCGSRSRNVKKQSRAEDILSCPSPRKRSKKEAESPAKKMSKSPAGRASSRRTRKR